MALSKSTTMKDEIMNILKNMSWQNLAWSIFIFFVILALFFYAIYQASTMGDTMSVHKNSVVILNITYKILMAIFMILLFVAHLRVSLGYSQPESFIVYYTNSLVYGVLCAMWFLLALMVIAFTKIMIDTDWLSIFCYLLGTKGKEDTLAFIGLGMGGVLAFINGITLYFRTKEQTWNNELVEKGNIEDRLQDATENLGHGEMHMRITSFYQFCYVASENIGTLKKTREFRENIFKILCLYLRTISGKLSRPLSDITSQAGVESTYYALLEECQILFDILFKNKFKSNKNKEGIIHNKHKADLRRIYLPGINFKDANLSYANLSNSHFPGTNFLHANLSGANLTHADLSRARLPHANLSGADLSDADLSRAVFLDTDLSHADLRSADLSHADFQDADLSHADLQNATLENTKLNNVRSIKETDFRGTGIKRADLPLGKGTPITDE